LQMINGAKEFTPSSKNLPKLVRGQKSEL
jgi:hypothetical protein